MSARAPRPIPRPDRLLAMACWVPRVTAFAWSIEPRLAGASIPDYLAAITPVEKSRAPILTAEEMIRVIANVLRWKRGRMNHGCFVRSFTRYRFLREIGQPVRFHLGIETRGAAMPALDPASLRDPGNSPLRSHAWITLDGVPFHEADPGAIAGWHTLLSWPPESVA